MPSCLRLLAQLARLAASRTFCNAGRSSAISTAMMAMTTSSSISVKPRERARWRVMDSPPKTDGDEEWSATSPLARARGWFGTHSSARVHFDVVSAPRLDLEHHLLDALALRRVG